MNLTTKELIINTYQDQNYIPESLKEKYSEFKPSSVEIGDNTLLIKFSCIEEAIPYLDQILNIINDNIISIDSLTMPQLIGMVIQARNGKIYDTQLQWDGTTFIISEGDNVKGVCIGHKEVEITTKGNRIFKGKGFIPHFAVNTSIRGTYKSLILGVSTVLALANKGCSEISGVTRENNILARRLYESASYSWHEEYPFYKYFLDIQKINRIYDIALKRSKLSINQINLLNLLLNEEF